MSYNIFGIVLKVILVTTNKEKNRVYYLTFIILSKFRINILSLFWFEYIIMRTFDASYIYRAYLGKWDLGLVFSGNVCLWTHAQKKVKFDDWYSAPAYISCIMHYFSLHIYSFSATFFRLWFDTILKHCTNVYKTSSYGWRMAYFYDFKQEL